MLTNLCWLEVRLLQFAVKCFGMSFVTHLWVCNSDYAVSRMCAVNFNSFLCSFCYGYGMRSSEEIAVRGTVV